MSKCITCKTELENTNSSFTGTCNYDKGQYITFYYCPNKNCDRYKLYCDHYIGENQ